MIGGGTGGGAKGDPETEVGADVGSVRGGTKFEGMGIVIVGAGTLLFSVCNILPRGNALNAAGTWNVG